MSKSHSKLNLDDLIRLGMLVAEVLLLLHQATHSCL